MDSLDMRELLQWLEHHYHHDSCTVRVCDDTAWAVEGILGIALRYNQWHIIVHTECA